MRQLGVIFGTFCRHPLACTLVVSCVWAWKLSSNHETHFSFTKKKESLTQHSLSNTFPKYHTLSVSHTSHPSKCHRLGRTLHRCQRFRGPRINITSFLSIRAYLFPSSYCTSASDPICIPGKSPDESRPCGEGKTEWDKDEERGGKRMRGEIKVGGVWGEESEQGRKKWARSFKIHRGDEICWCLTLSYYRWKWIQDSALSQMVNMPCSMEA